MRDLNSYGTTGLKILQAIIATSVLTALLLLGFWVIRELRIDACLDRGGAWDYQIHACMAGVEHERTN